MAHKLFVPMNDINLPEDDNATEETSTKIKEGVISAYVPDIRPLPPSEATPGQMPNTMPGMNPGGFPMMPGSRVNEVDFVWGFFMFDMPSVYTDKNKVYFQGEIYRESVAEVRNAIINLGKDLVCKYNDLGIYDLSKIPPIELWINSPGGAVSAGFSLIDFMNNFYLPINTVGTGTIASMAVLLLLAGKQRVLTTNANLLVHQFRAGVQGKRDEIMDYLKHFDDLQEQMVSYIAKYTKLSKDKVKDLLAKESWLTSAESLSMGFVDKLIG